MKKPTALDLHCLSFSMWICTNNQDQVIWLAENFWSGHDIWIYITWQVLKQRITQAGAKRLYQCLQVILLFMHFNVFFTFKESLFLRIYFHALKILGESLAVSYRKNGSSKMDRRYNVLYTFWSFWNHWVHSRKFDNVYMGHWRGLIGRSYPVWTRHLDTSTIYMCVVGWVFFALKGNFF